MGALTDLSDLINRQTGGNGGAPETIWFTKGPRFNGATTSITTGRWSSLWRFDGTIGAGAAPTTGAIPTASTTGAFPITNPASGNQKWLTQFWAGTVGGAGFLMLYDRLFHIGNLSGTVTTAQTVQGSPASPALTRYTDGLGVQIFVEIYTALGSTTTTITANYTNSSGTPNRTTTAVTIGGGGANEIHRLFCLPLQAGDKGVQSVQSVTLAGTTGTAGAFGITLVKPLAFVNLPNAGMFGFRDFAVGLPGIPEIKSDACLALAINPPTTTVPELSMAGISMVEA